ncbi:hypothetical protein FRC11_010888 [Ceratobasidium sp. 423]|nr:hypothetical protein FRC11_010888 [Ceratobasidium sp. 423]
MLNMKLGGVPKGQEHSESTSRMNTPTPGNVVDDASLLFRASLAPNSDNNPTYTTEYDSSNDTEPEEGKGDMRTAFTSFNSYRTADTSLAISERNLAQLTSSNGAAPGLRVRRSISADRLTMRPLSPPAPPPLLRTRPDGPSHLIPQSPNALNESAARPISPGTNLPPSPRVNKLVDANNILNTFCGQQVYSNIFNPNYTSDNESGDDQQRGLNHARNTPPSPLHVGSFSKKDKGKGRASEYEATLPNTALNYGDLDSQGFLPMGFKRSTFGPTDDTDDDRRYETVSEGISESEDFNIPTSIPSTSTLPPAPLPTVSRSRSSSRSFPSAQLNHDIPPVPPLPPFALLGSRARAASSPRLAAAPLGSPMTVDRRSLLTPTPTQSLNNALPPTPSSASMSVSSSSASLSSAILDPITIRPRPSRNVSPQPGHSSAPEKSRQRSISESGGGSGAGSSSGNGSNSRGRFANGLAQALRKTPSSTSSGRGIEHIKPTKHRARPKYTFAFVGSGGCGKTALIEKGSKAANSRYKPQVALKTVRYGDVDMTFEVRDACLLVDKAHSAYPVNAIELDSAPFIKALETGTQFWPPGMPEVDGVVLCYDASAEGNARGSFDYIVQLTAAFAALHFPMIWVACKSDWIRPPKKDAQPTSPRVLPAGIVSPQQVYLLANNEHTGLIEVTKNSHHGKEQMRNMMTWMYKAIGRARRSREDGEKDQEYHNHASPDVLNRRSNSSRPPPITVPARSSLVAAPAAFPHPPSPASPPPKSPVSPSTLLAPQRVTRARSMSDLLSQAARDQITETSAAVLRKASATVSPMVLPRPTRESITSTTDTTKELDPGSRGPSSDVPKMSDNTSIIVLQSKYTPDPFAFATFDQLIMRLLWGSGSEADDATFRIAFGLTYRRFAAPRTVLLSIIRYIRGSDGDDRTRAVAILSDYLGDWTHKYPTDFAAPGAIPPLETLIRVLGENGFEERALELEEHLPLLNTLKDDATDWAKPTLDFTEHSDSDTERDPDSRPNSSEIQCSSGPSLSVLVSTTTVVESASSPAAHQSPTLARRPSSVAPVVRELSETEEQELKRVGKLILASNPEHVAQEITRIDHEFFMSIQSRDWLRHAYTTRRDRDPAVHALDQIAHRFERLGLLIDSLILVSPKIRHRGTMFEYFLRVALILRSYNNFAALHSIVAALDKIYCGEEGEEIESFIQGRDISWNKWLSLRVLILKSNGTAYKTALKHTTQPLIPTMAIHTSDLVRVMSNRDYKEGDPTLIHWGKFQIIAKIVNQMIELQGRLRTTDNYNFPARPDLASLLNDPKTMTDEMIVQKTFPSMNETNAGRAGTWGARVLRKVFPDR